MTFINPRPEVGEWSVLVYRECVCGFWCATGEGSRAPLCPDCQIPIPHPFRGEPPSPEAAKDALGFAAQLLPEVTGDESAVATTRRLADKAGQEVRWCAPWPERHYDPESVKRQVGKILEGMA